MVVLVLKPSAQNYKIKNKKGGPNSLAKVKTGPSFLLTFAKNCDNIVTIRFLALPKVV